MQQLPDSPWLSQVLSINSRYVGDDDSQSFCERQEHLTNFEAIEKLLNLDEILCSEIGADKEVIKKVLLYLNKQDLILRGYNGQETLEALGELGIIDLETVQKDWEG